MRLPGIVRAEALWRVGAMSMESERHRRERRERYSAMAEPELVEAIRLDDPWAADEFTVRYHRLLLNRASRAGIRREQCEDSVMETLERVLRGLALGTITVQKSVAAYLVTVFWRDYRRADMARRRREALIRQNVVDVAGTKEGLIVDAMSQYAIRASHGPGWDPPPVALAVERLASMVDEEMSEEEQRFVVWVANEVDIRAFAPEFGMNYEALAKRIYRLRRRMRETALRHAEQFSVEDRASLVRFFTRANRLYEAAVMAASVEREREARVAERRPDHGREEER